MIKEELETMKKELDSAKKIKEEITYLNLISLIKMIIIMWVISIALIVGGFLLFLNQYDFETEETTTETVEQDSGDTGINNYIGRDGAINNGETKNN